MATPSKVTDTDKGLRALLKRLKAEKWAITVGVHGPEGAETHQQPEPPPKESPTDGAEEPQKDAPAKVTVLDVAVWNEYGTGHVPERSFIRDWADQNEQQNKDNLRKIAIAVYQGKYDIRTGLDRLGLLFVGQIQRRISAGISPPNAPSTIEKKGSSTPLINFGQLRASILHKVTKGNGS